MESGNNLRRHPSVDSMTDEERMHLLCSVLGTLGESHPLRHRIENAFAELKRLRLPPGGVSSMTEAEMDRFEAASDALDAELTDLASVAWRLVQ
jgi:hypothetical protein